jgi:hypothetical protein
MEAAPSSSNPDDVLDAFLHRHDRGPSGSHAYAGADDTVSLNAESLYRPI